MASQTPARPQFARRPRTALLLAASTLALTAAGAAQAQDADEGARAVDDIIVTGTRVQGRSRLDTLVPVDVVTSETLQNRGTTELAAQLAATVPALTFPRPSLTDGTDAVRPASLRGQGPDQTLVLVNGVRRHTSALLNVNGTVGRGSAAVDLNAIPSTAVDRIEVLRDGASAQYGSDAIAGVINLRLREASSGGGATVTYGQYLSSVDFHRGGRRDLSDGASVTVAGWQGFAVGDDGFLTVSAEHRDREHTNRSDIDPRATPERVRARFGDPDTEDLAVYANFGKPLSGQWEAYGWAGYLTRQGSSAAGVRLPTDNAQNPDYPGVGRIYPDGYLPLIETETEDFTIAGGLRGVIGGFDVDVNLGYGLNRLDYAVADTLNPSLGPTSPTYFGNAGGLRYSQLVFGADFTQAFDAGLAGPLNVAFGLEARNETFEIVPGDLESYVGFPQSPFNFSPGARGFGGFAPQNAVDVDRHNVGIYAELEAEVVENLTLSGAVRFEDYSDFGTSTTGKIAARYDVSPAFAVRGAVSTGFRAPSLHQQYYTSVSITYLAGVPDPVQSGTFPSNGAIARALGGVDLEAEDSVNVSAGVVWRKGGFELTVDAYRIQIDDRIILSNLLQGSATAAPGTNARVIYDLLSGTDATAARFFINGVDTETSGIDIVARNQVTLDNGGVFVLTGAANVNSYKVTRLPYTDTFSSTSTLPERVALFGRQDVVRFEEGVPPWKTVFQADLSDGPWALTTRASTYGSVTSAGTSAATDSETGVRTLIDLEGRYRFTDNVSLAVGADNLFDTYPSQISTTLNTTGASPFSSFSPFGFNGRYVYARLNLSW